jgi:hypothetical protein
MIIVYFIKTSTFIFIKELILGPKLYVSYYNRKESRFVAINFKFMLSSNY